MSTAATLPALPAPASAAPATQRMSSPLEFAVEQILAKQSKQAILSQLFFRYGFSGADAENVLRQAYAVKHTAFRQQGVKTLLAGIAMLVFGALITGVTYSMVADQGGTYVVTYGLIAIGVVKIFQGLFRIAVG